MISREMFDAKVPFKPTDGCWLWNGQPSTTGYGVIKSGGRTHKAHRLAWRFAYGSIPRGLCVCHHCDVRMCVNPAHLFLATNEENTADRKHKGRSARQYGESNGSAKLTAEMVARIRSDYEPRKVTQDVLAKRYGVSPSMVGLIVRGERWPVRVVKVEP